MRLLFILLLVVLQPAYANDLKEASVIIEVSKEATEKCEFSRESVRGQIETIVRQNNIKVQPLANGPVFYVMLSASFISSDNSCYGHGYIQIFSDDPLKPKWSKKPVVGVYEHCLRTFSFTGRKGYEQQSSINNVLADLTRQCISKILK
jgi:hypothetical protein